MRRTTALGCLCLLATPSACTGQAAPPTVDAGAALTAREVRRALRTGTPASPTANETRAPGAFALPTAITPWTARPDHFVMRRAHSTAFFTPTGFSLALRAGSAAAPKGWGLHVDLVGGQAVAPRAERRQRAVVRDGRAAATELSTYGQLAWEEVYPGTDMVVEPEARGFSYRFVLSPDADPTVVGLRFDGADAVRLAEGSRNLDVQTGLGPVAIRGLRAYSIEDGQQVEVGVRFVLRGDVVGVEVDGWRRRGPLVIDPVVSWSGRVGGSSYDLGTSMVVDASGNLLVAGTAGSVDFPSTGGFDATLGGSYDAFVAKVSGSGTLLWSTYLGGGGWDEASRLALDSAGNAYVVGYTQSSDFPTTGGFDTTLGGSRDAFVTKVSSAGALVWSSYLGGASDDFANGVAVDGGNLYVTGYTQSSTFATAGAADTTLGGTQDAFVTKISTAGAVSWSRFLGGAATDEGKAVAVDGSGNVYVVGKTASTDFPVASAFDATHNGADDAFVTKLDGTGAITWASFLGGAGLDQPNQVAVDGTGAVVVVGTTNSTDFPTTGGFDTVSDGVEAFVTKVSGAGVVQWSSFLGGTSLTETGLALALDGTGNVYVGGSTTAADFPSTGGFKATLSGFSDGFVTKLSSTGAFGWSSYVGGGGNDTVTALGFDSAGTVYLAGTTNSSDFPGAPAAAAGNDAFVVKLGPATLATGTACTVDGACVSGHCADGVCCDTACTGPCVACTAAKKGSGTSGTCGPIADGSDPDKDCAAQSCTAGVVTKANVCNGAGACRGTGTTSCGLFACVGADCGTTCTTDADCLPSAFCNGTTCVADLAAGSTCNRPGQCTSGFCADNVCCDKACGGGCEACTATKKGKGSDGVCEPVVAGSDPKDACTPDSGFPTSCKADGFCDGAGACRVYAPSGTACGTSTCASGVASGKTCNGAGGCDATPKSCGDYTCADDKVCRTTCAGDGDCATSAFCTAAGTCAPKGAPGATCGAAKECASGFCADGVCCDKACDGQCEACDVAGKAGSCQTVSGKPHGKKTACADDGNGCAGTCDGTTAIACAYPDAKTVCGPGCVGSKIARCDGKGACSAPTACADSLLCASDKACKDKCKVNEDCIKGMTCDTASGLCTPARPTCNADLTASVSPDGVPTSCNQYLCDRPTGTCHKTCTTADQCASGFACAGDKCEPVTPPVAEDSGCAYGGGPSGSLGVLAVLAAGAGLARRRRR